MKIRLPAFPLTVIATGNAVVVVLLAIWGHVDIVTIPVQLVQAFAQNSVDDVVVALVLVLVAFVADQSLVAKRRDKELRLQTERLHVVQVTMRTVQDIVNNALNQLQLVRFEAEGKVSGESLALFDRTIEETAAKLNELGDLAVYSESQMEMGPGLSTSTR